MNIGWSKFAAHRHKKDREDFNTGFSYFDDSDYELFCID